MEYKTKKQNLIAILGLFALFIVAFSSGRVIAPANAQGVVGSVYIMSNSASGNQVIAYSRAPDGTLTWRANYATNGLGITGLTGSNQGGLVLSENGRWLIVANAGSNDVENKNSINANLYRIFVPPQAGKAAFPRNQ